MSFTTLERAPLASGPLRGPTFAQRRVIAQMQALGANPLQAVPDEHGEVLVLVARGDGTIEVKAIQANGEVRSLTHAREDASPQEPGT